MKGFVPGAFGVAQADRQKGDATTVNRFLALMMLFAVILAAGCHGETGDYVAASAISRNGFAVDGEALRKLDSKEVKLWGYVDQGNLYGDDAARAILGDWWSGPSPDAATWRFDLKANADDDVGRSFQVHVPNDPGWDDLLERFVADARAQQPTRVFVTGKLYTFAAPTNIAARTGLSMEVASSAAILLDAANDNEEDKMSLNALKPAYVTALEAAYGPPSQAGFGSAVFQEALAASDDLATAALAKYKDFVGDLWQRYGEDAWMGPWREVYARPAGVTHDIVAELRGITDADAQNSVPLILDVVEDAKNARAALAAAFDDPAVTELRVFNLGDGEAMSGILVAARRGATGDATSLVFLLD